MTGRRLNIFITLVIALCAAVAGWTCWQHRVCQQLVRAWADGHADEFPGVVVLHDYDANFRIAAPDGNLAIRFLNFDPNNQSQLNTVQEMFCRGAYALYPRRAWVVPDGTILNGGRDALDAHFAPTQQWLLQHDVRAVVEALADEKGVQSIHLVPVSPGGAP